MKKILIITTALLLLVSCSSKEETKVVSERTTQENRAAYQAETVDSLILKNLKKDLNKSTEADWQGAFWASEVLQFREKFLKDKLEQAFNYYDEASPSFRRSLIQNVYTLFPNQFNEEVESVLKKTSNSKIFVMCANYLKTEIPSNDLLDLMKSKFTDWESDPILFMLNEDLLQKEESIPPIVDMLTKDFGDVFVIYSFQRSNRDFRGITIVKDQDGKFVRNEDGSLFTIQHFARAVTNMPPYVTNGNTPQGIFSFQGFDVSSNKFIGPTTNIQLVMPFEAVPSKYFRNHDINKKWNLELYKNMLPESWKNYTPIYEAFYAGKAGRTEIIAHGTTINPDYYKAQIYYPYTPSLGCLTANEIWSPETGERLESDQQKLVDKVESLNADKGFFVLVELGNQDKDVTTADLLKDILKAEK